MKPPRPFDVCTRRRCLEGLARGLGLGGLGLASRVRAQTARRLKVGLTPFLPTRLLMGTYEPLRLHLSARLQREVEFYTAPSFERMLDNARAVDQPFTMMPVHLALMVIEHEGFTLVARSTADSALALWQPPEQAAPWPPEAALSTPATGASPAVLNALRGRRIGVSSALTLAAMVTARWCEDRTLAAAVELRTYANLSVTVLAARRGEVDFVAAPDGALRDALPAGAPEFRRLLTLARLEAPAFVASPTVTPAETAAFRSALLAFNASGASFGTAQYVAGSTADLAPWRAYAARARQLLAKPALPGR